MCVTACFKGTHTRFLVFLDSVPVLLSMSGETLYPRGPCCPFLPLDEGNEDYRKTRNEIGEIETSNIEGMELFHVAVCSKMASIRVKRTRAEWHGIEVLRTYMPHLHASHITCAVNRFKSNFAKKHKCCVVICILSSSSLKGSFSD